MWLLSRQELKWKPNESCLSVLQGTHIFQFIMIQYRIIYYVCIEKSLCFCHFLGRWLICFSALSSETLHISNSLIGSRKKLCWLRNQWYQTTVCGWQPLDLNQLLFKSRSWRTIVHQGQDPYQKENRPHTMLLCHFLFQKREYISLQSITWTPNKTTMYVFTH